MKALTGRKRARIRIAAVTAAAVAATVLGTVLPQPAGAAAAAAAQPYYAWGDNAFSDLGDGSNGPQYTPEAVPLADGITPVQISAGGRYGAALGSDGQVYVWGVILVSDFTSPVPVALPLPGGVPAAAVATAGSFAVILGRDGLVYQWGVVPPDEARYDTPTPVALPGGDKAASVFAYGSQAGAVGVDGKFFVWGQNTDGQLGDGTTTDRPAPEQVTLPGGDVPAQVAFGYDYGMAVGTDGKLFAWGDNTYGQLGDGTGTSRLAPEQIALPGGVKAVKAATGDRFGMALGADHRVYTWGDNTTGDLGGGTTTSRPTPAAALLPGGVGATDIDANDLTQGSAYATGTDGRLYDWGYDEDGLELGDGGTVNRPTPAALTTLPGVGLAQVSVAGQFGFAISAPQALRPAFVAAQPPKWTAAGGAFGYTFIASAVPAPTYSLAAGAPAWLSIDAASGRVHGTVPTTITSFTFAVTAANSQGSTTTPAVTVDVGPLVAISGRVTDAAGTVAPGSLVQSCASPGCTQTTADSAGAYHLTGIAGDTATLTGFPVAAESGLQAQHTVGPVTVPAAGLSGLAIALEGFAPLPPGTSVQSPLSDPGGPATLYWATPYPMTATGCANGVGVATLSGQNTVTGDYDYSVISLDETPAGSGSYAGTIPPQEPVHGPADLETSVVCPPSGAVQPTTGPASGGTTVAITGSGFTGADGVEFGSSPATGVRVLGDDAIQAVAPAGSGTVAVTVLHGTKQTAAGRFAYAGVSSVSPATGPASGGTRVVVTGTGLGRALGVVFGAVGADFTQVSDTEIDAVSPPGTGTQDIEVVTSTGVVTAAGASDRFTYTGSAPSAVAAGPPAARQAQPSASSAAMTTTISASALAALPAVGAALPVPKAIPALGLPSAAQVFDVGYTLAGPFIKPRIKALLDGVQALRHPTCETTEAALASVIAAANSAKLALVTADGGAYIAGLMSGYFTGEALALAVALAPWIASVVVGIFFGLMIAAAAVNLAFQHFCPGYSAHGDILIDPSGTVLDTAGNPVAGATATILRADTADGPFAPVGTASPGISPPVNPEATASDGGFHWDVSSGYYEVEATAPGCTDPGDPSKDSVTIGPYPVPPPQVGLTVTLACGSSAPPVPAVQRLSQAAGAPGGGDTVIVTGTGFTPAAAVTFGGAAAASVDYLSPNALSVVTPAAPSGGGTVDVVVRTAGGASPVAAADRFAYGSVPVVTALSSHQGGTAGGQSVTVTGTGFGTATGVTFGSTPAKSVEVLSDTRLQAVAPAADAGAVDIRVLNPVGISATAAADRYTYQTGTTSTPTAVHRDAGADGRHRHRRVAAALDQRRFGRRRRPGHQPQLPRRALRRPAGGQEGRTAAADQRIGHRTRSARPGGDPASAARQRARLRPRRRRRGQPLDRRRGAVPGLPGHPVQGHGPRRHRAAGRADRHGVAAARHRRDRQRLRRRARRRSLCGRTVRRRPRGAGRDRAVQRRHRQRRHGGVPRREDRRHGRRPGGARVAAGRQDVRRGRPFLDRRAGGERVHRGGGGDAGGHRQRHGVRGEPRLPRRADRRGVHGGVERADRAGRRGERRPARAFRRRPGGPHGQRPRGHLRRNRSGVGEARRGDRRRVAGGGRVLRSS